MKKLFLLALALFFPISAFASLDTSVISSYPLTANSTDVVSANNGTDVNISYGTVSGEASASFDGSSSYITTSLPVITGSGDFSICLAVYPTSTGGVLVNNRKLFPDDNVGIYYMWLDGTNHLGFWDYDGGFAFSPSSVSSTALNLNAWNTVCFTRASGTGTYYVNGASSGTNPATSGISYSTDIANHYVTIGDDGEGHANKFTGSIGEVDFWNRAISGAEATEYHNSGTIFHYPFSGGSTPPPPPADPIGAWLASTSVAFQDTTGFSLASSTQWVGTSLLMPIVGNGIGIVYGLRYWIIVLVVLGALITFTFRGFRFYKH